MARSVTRINGLVRATARGYDGTMMRAEGDTFQFEGVLGSWMVAVEPADASAKPKRRGRPPKDVAPDNSISS